MLHVNDWMLTKNDPDWFENNNNLYVNSFVNTI